MTESKQMGISLGYFITHKDDISITDNEVDNYLDEFIELVERYGWVCGGGVRLLDVNTEED